MDFLPSTKATLQLRFFKLAHGEAFYRLARSSLAPCFGYKHIRLPFVVTSLPHSIKEVIFSTLSLSFAFMLNISLRTFTGHSNRSSLRSCPWIFAFLRQQYIFSKMTGIVVLVCCARTRMRIEVCHQYHFDALFPNTSVQDRFEMCQEVTFGYIH